MKAAKDYAKLSVRAGQLAAEVDPPEEDACVYTLKLAQFHMRLAATLLLRVADFKAELAELEKRA